MTAKAPWASASALQCVGAPHCNGLASTIRQARDVTEPSGKDVKIASGVTATEALRLGLLDEIMINQIPVLLTAGNPHFHELPHAIELERTSVPVDGSVTHLTFRVIKPAQHPA